MLAPWKKSYDKPRQCIKKQKHHFADKSPHSQSYDFPVVMYGCESWTIKKAEFQRTDAFVFCLFVWFLFFIFYFFCFGVFFFLTLQYCIGFAKYRNESATGIHVFPILNPPPSSLPMPSLWVVPVHQPQASSIVHRTWTGDSFHT